MKAILDVSSVDEGKRPIILYTFDRIHEKVTNKKLSRNVPKIYLKLGERIFKEIEHQSLTKRMEISK